MTAVGVHCYGVCAMRNPVPARGRFSSEEAEGVNQGLTVLSYLIAGVLVWGGIGWLVDRVLDTAFLTPIGIVAGAAASVYLVIKRFGQLGMVDESRAQRPDDHKPDDHKEAG